MVCMVENYSLSPYFLNLHRYGVLAEISLFYFSFQFKLKLIYFFLSGFSFTDTDDSQDSRVKEGTIFFPLYNLHPLTNVQKFTCSSASKMTASYFQSQCMLDGCQSNLHVMLKQFFL